MDGHTDRQTNSHYTAGASSRCYCEKIMLLKCELMLFKCQINTSTNKNEFLQLPTIRLEGVLKYSYLISIIYNFLFMFADLLSLGVLQPY